MNGGLLAKSSLLCLSGIQPALLGKQVNTTAAQRLDFNSDRTKSRKSMARVYAQAFNWHLRRSKIGRQFGFDFQHSSLKQCRRVRCFRKLQARIVEGCPLLAHRVIGDVQGGLRSLMRLCGSVQSAPQVSHTSDTLCNRLVSFFAGCHKPGKLSSGSISQFRR